MPLNEFWLILINHHIHVYFFYDFRPKEFTDCIGHIRLLSWLLIGSLTHTGMTEGTAPVSCQPIPLDASSYIAEHVLVIMTGFDERSKVNINLKFMWI